MSRILQEIESKIGSIRAVSPTRVHVGVVQEVGDGVTQIDGLSRVVLNEMLEFPRGEVGLALNLEETSIGAIILGDYTSVREGDEVRCTGKLLQIPVGLALLGRVVNALGVPIDGKGPISTEESYPLERNAPSIIQRQPVTQSLQTGIISIDAMIPIGRGQRQLIIGDRSTGKTTIALDTILNQAVINRTGTNDPNFRPVYSVYVAIGQKNASIARVISILESRDALRYTVVVCATASESATVQYIAPFAGMSMGEWFMEHGRDALVVFDDLSKHAVAYRQISLLLKRPSGREAYPGDIFYLHSRLLERSARLNAEAGNGSLTALPIIETQAGDVSSYIPTNVISITDGQIYLETELFYQGIRPAVSVGLSVSRVGSAAQAKVMKQVAGRIRGDLAQFRELAAFAQFGSDLDAKTRLQLSRGQRIVELFKQRQHSLLSLPHQVILLWGVKNGFLDALAVDQIHEYDTKLIEFMNSRKSTLVEKISETQQVIDDELEKELKYALEEFAKLFP